MNTKTLLIVLITLPHDATQSATAN